MMKKLIALLLLCMTAGAAQAVLVDAFSGDLSAYTKSVVLDQDGTKAISFAISSGTLQASKSTGNNAEQAVLLRSDYGLGIGQILRIDTAVPSSTVYGDLGIAISATVDPADAVWTSGTADARRDMMAIYLKRQTSQVGYLGLDGTTSLGGSSGALTAPITYTSITGLFIERSATGEYKLGITTSAGDTVLKTYTGVSNTAIGTAIGLYTDVRNATTIGGLDNLRIVPEPATLALLGLGGLAMIRRRA